MAGLADQLITPQTSDELKLDQGPIKEGGGKLKEKREKRRHYSQVETTRSYLRHQNSLSDTAWQTITPDKTL
ncbi:hypothetical protein ACDH58_25025, partial [Pseudomonas tremae]